MAYQLDDDCGGDDGDECGITQVAPLYISRKDGDRSSRSGFECHKNDSGIASMCDARHRTAKQWNEETKSEKHSD